jgi:hypothetical protein
VLDEAHTTEGSEEFGGVRVELRLRSMEKELAGCWVDEHVRLMQSAQYFFR